MSCFNHFSNILISSALVVFLQPAIVLAQAPQQSIREITRRITVRIDPPGTELRNGGSGVIIARQGNQYTVLTAWHVVDGEGLAPVALYSIQTWRGEQISVPVNQVQRLSNLDLAVLQFTSDQEYEVARLATSRIYLTEGLRIHAGGWANPTQNVQGRLYIGTMGSVVGRISASNGYELVYSLEHAQMGMSGGPVLTENGTLIAVTGLARPDPITNEYDLISGIPADRFSGLMFALGFLRGCLKSLRGQILCQAPHHNTDHREVD